MGHWESECVSCREEVLGKNCRFLQGPDTSREDAELIRKAVTSQHPKPITVSPLCSSRALHHARALAVRDVVHSFPPEPG